MVLSDLDRSLLDRCLQGADGAWENFVDRYIALITHVVNSTGKLRLGNIPDQWRDDIVAEVLLALVENDFAVLRRFRGQSSLGTYLVVVARRVAVRKLSKMKFRPKHLSVDQASGAAAPQFHLDDSEEVYALLGQMPESEATAIRMFHLEHRTYSDIGQHIGLPENSVGPLLSKARDRMRRLKEVR
ncbi:MAG: sigma-70 family RNA polymerase sigma factor [Pirellulaceae bacterium]